MDRSLRMINAAKMLLNTGEYDIAVLLAIQAIEMCIKAKLLEKLGSIPRVKPLRRLFNELETAFKDRKNDIRDFFTKNKSMFVMIEEAYISLRYLDRLIAEEEASKIVGFAEKVIDFAKKL